MYNDGTCSNVKADNFIKYCTTNVEADSIQKNNNKYNTNINIYAVNDRLAVGGRKVYGV